MSILHDAYTALLAGITTKTGNEIHWEDKYGNPITVELVDLETEAYTVRYYYKNGQKCWEINYQNDQLHGKHIGWYKSGQKRSEIDYHQGQPHGKYIWWYENGQKQWEYEYQNGKRIK